jgi:hypothetical protein
MRSQKLVDINIKPHRDSSLTGLPGAEHFEPLWKM